MSKEGNFWNTNNMKTKCLNNELQNCTSGPFTIICTSRAKGLRYFILKCYLPISLLSICLKLKKNPINFNFFNRTV